VEADRGWWIDFDPRLLLMMSNGRKAKSNPEIVIVAFRPTQQPVQGSSHASHGPMIGLFQYCEGGIDSFRTFVLLTGFLFFTHENKN
jgi:hypothetical protein